MAGIKNLLKRRKLIACVLTIFLLFGVIQTLAASIDDSNQDFDTSNPVGSATPGKANYSPYAQMWKVSVYVAKTDTVTNSAEYRLSKDYHKFGETFWIYGDGMGVEQVVNYGVSPEKIYLELHNKEEYVNGNAKFIQAKYSDLKSRVFKGSENGFSGRNSVPSVHNFPDGADSIDEIKAFFDDNKNTSNIFVSLAAKSAKSTPDKLLKELEFTINGETKSGWNTNMIDVRTNVSSSRSDHTSCVSWVFLYEPVIIINGTDITGYYHGVTATGIAAAMKQGVYNWTSSSDQFIKMFKNGVSESVPTPAWGLGTTFPFGKMPNSIFLSEDWLGYKSGAYWKSWNNKANSEWYTESQFEGGGFGLRYQRAVVPKVIISKTINGNSESTLPLSNFKMTITSKDTGEKWETVTDAKGNAIVYLPSGKYTLSENTEIGYEKTSDIVFTVPDDATVDSVIKVSINNETIKTGTLHISKVTSDGNYDGVSFCLTNSKYESFTLDFSKSSGNFVLWAKNGNEKVSAKYTVTTAVCGDGKTCKRLNIYGLPIGEWTITENCPKRYIKTLVGYNHENQVESKNYTIEINKNTSQWVRYDNFTGTKSLTIVKRIKKSDIVWAHGTPTFFVKVSCGDKWVIKSFEFTEEYVSNFNAMNAENEWVEMSVVVDGYEYGDKVTVQEFDVLRYRLYEDGVEIISGEGQVIENKAVVLMGTTSESKVRFSNEKYYQGGTSHNDFVINEFVAEG